MRSRGFWIALAIVLLLYVIARPHVGAVWFERKVTGSLHHSGQPQVVVLPAPYPSFKVCDQKARSDTAANAAADQRLAAPLTSLTAFTCGSKNALLWGW
jgi:hypothetical protein